MKKILSVNILIVLIWSMVMSISVMAASHDSENPTTLTPNVSYESNAYYGDEYYTFTLTEESQVNISLERVAINHTYIMTLHGNGITPIATNDSSDDDALSINTTLLPGTYYIDLDSDFDGLSEDAMLVTEPSETGYTITVHTTPV